MQQVIEQMRNDVIDLRGDRRGNGRGFFRELSGRDPKKAKVANALTKSQYDENLKIRERQSAGTADFSAPRLTIWKEVAEQEKQVMSSARHSGGSRAARCQPPDPEQLTTQPG
jgi:hypothetical protein